jgi:dynactin-6
MKADITGNVYFGDGCVVHQGAVIHADGGEIYFGENCVIEEYVKIINQQRKDREGNIVKKTMRIGSHNLFEIGSQISSSDIGDYNEFQINCKIGGGSAVGSSCSITPNI